MLLPPESRNRVQKAAIVPLTVLQPALKQFGRTDATVAILLACGKLDKQWRMAIEDEANAAEGLVDLELTEDLAAERALELCDELGEWDLAHELLTAELPYGVDPEDEAKAANTQLSPVPAAVTKELEHFVAYRREEFNAHRTGPVVETTTVSGDQATALRFLKYLKEKEGQEQVSLKLFAHAQVGTWTQRYMTWLRGELGLKSSTIAVYCNAILTVATYALTLVPAAERDACELQQLVNLRAQAETRWVMAPASVGAMGCAASLPRRQSSSDVLPWSACPRITTTCTSPPPLLPSALAMGSGSRCTASGSRCWKRGVKPTWRA